jgi:YgiT-type zinc finger domain-containing protein
MIEEKAEEGWRLLSEEVISGIKEWRVQHPRATLREMEMELDQRLSRVRARMLEDLALASRARDWAGERKEVCPECGGELKRHGLEERHLQTEGGQEIRLERRYGVCTTCGAGFFPPG